MLDASPTVLGWGVSRTGSLTSVNPSSHVKEEDRADSPGLKC